MFECIFRLHQMHEMQMIITNVSVTRLNWLHCAKTAVLIKILFGLYTLEDARNIVLDGVPDPPTERGET